MSRVSLYFFAGDFSDVLRRYHAGEEQIYQTHNEVARLLLDLTNAGLEVTIFSLVTPRASTDDPIPGLRVVGLGSASYQSNGVLRAAVAGDNAEKVVVHFPNMELLTATMRSPARAISLLANSYNGHGLRAVLERRRVAQVLNSPRFEWVSNHCLPATEHLASMGVHRSKLVPWDVPHPRRPDQVEAKRLPTRRPFTVMYAGSVVESKGVGDLIRATALLRRRGLDVCCTLAGNGDLDAMAATAVAEGVADRVEFVGLIGNDNVADRMRAADLVVVPSRRQYTEGFPLTMFEALASRTPIVCSDHPMFRAHLIDGRTASVFPSGEAGAFAAAMERTLTTPALYERLSLAATDTWSALEGPADWRTLLRNWLTDTNDSWIRDRALDRARVVG